MKRVYPRAWLFTDERQGERLWAALARVPRGAGVVFRHYGAPGRVALGKRVRAAARRRGAAFVVAGTARDARAMRADGQHKPGWARGGWALGLRTASAHDLAELRAAERAGAGLVFISPLFPTASHPGGRELGRVRFALLARAARARVAALGGINATRFRKLAALGAVAWGAVDASGRLAQRRASTQPSPQRGIGESARPPPCGEGRGGGAMPDMEETCQPTPSNRSSPPPSSSSS